MLFRSPPATRASAGTAAAATIETSTAPATVHAARLRPSPFLSRRAEGTRAQLTPRVVLCQCLRCPAPCPLSARAPAVDAGSDALPRRVEGSGLTRNEALPGSGGSRARKSGAAHCRSTEAAASRLGAQGLPTSRGGVPGPRTQCSSTRRARARIACPAIGCYTRRFA